MPQCPSVPAAAALGLQTHGHGSHGLLGTRTQISMPMWPHSKQFLALSAVMGKAGQLGHGQLCFVRAEAAASRLLGRAGRVTAFVPQDGALASVKDVMGPSGAGA